MRLRTELLRFAIVGISATLVHTMVLVSLVELGGINPVPSNGLAFMVAVGVTYLGQAQWVFRVPRHDTAQITRFAVSVIAGLLGNLAIMALVVDFLSQTYLLGLAAVLTIVPLATFALNKLWVFSGS